MTFSASNWMKNPAVIGGAILGVVLLIVSSNESDFVGAESGKYTTSVSSAVPSRLAGNMSQLFGDVSAGGGLKFPQWAVPLGIVFFFAAAIVAVIVLGRRK